MTGLILLGERYYDSDGRRFLSPDPLGYPICTNLYSYANSDPINFKDPTGRFSSPVYAPSGTTKFFPPIQHPKPRLDLGFESWAIKRKTRAQRGLWWQSPQSYDHLRSENIGPISSNLSGPSKGWFVNEHGIQIGVGLTNGIKYSRSEAIDSAGYLSALLGGINVNLTYNASHGFFADARETWKNWHGDITNPVAKLMEKWAGFFLDTRSDSRWLEYVHSQGSSVAYAALNATPESWRRRVNIAAIAPSKLIMDDLAESIVHVICSKDWVPRLDFIGRQTCRNSIIKVNPQTGTRGMHHSFKDPVYRQTISNLGKNFLKNAAD